MSKVILHKKFICTDSQYGTCGHNKFWECICYDNGKLETIYGRVGDSGMSTLKDYGSENQVLKKVKSLIAKKCRGKRRSDGGRDSMYKEIEFVGGTENISKTSKQIGKKTFQKITNDNPVVEELITYLEKQNIHNIVNNTNISYDATTGLFSTPLGVVGQTNINDARDVLSKMKKYVGKSDSKGDLLAEKFMMLIPQDIGRKRPNLASICHNQDKFDNLNSILDSLQASLDMVNTTPDKVEDDVEEDIDVGMNISPMLDMKEFKRIEKFYKQSQGKHECQHLSIDSIFSIRHNNMYKGWQETGSELKPIKELWHGSRVGNILSILFKGFYIPPSNSSHCTGRLFSNGVYFADCSTKSLQYSYGTWGNKSRDNNCFMFICDVALGKTYNPKSYGLSSFPDGYNSISALSGDTGLRYNEYIVNDINQINLKYLIKFTS